MMRTANAANVQPTHIQKKSRDFGFNPTKEWGMFTIKFLFLMFLGTKELDTIRTRSIPKIEKKNRGDFPNSCQKHTLTVQQRDPA